MAYLLMDNGRKLYYEEEGTGRPVILIHGWKASANVYSETSRRLTNAGGYRCIRYDQCGHMRSEIPEQPPTLNTLAQDLHRIITQLRLERPILVGWSMGGLTILEYLRCYGCDGLDRIVIVDISPKSLNDDTWKVLRSGGLYTLADVQSELALMRGDFRQFLRSYYCRSVPGFARSSVQAQDQRIEERMAGYDPKVLTSLWESIAMRDYLDVIPQIRCPAAIFHAGLMPSCPPEAAQYYIDHIPATAVKVCFENASHALITEQPEEFAAQLKKFFAM